MRLRKTTKSFNWIGDILTKNPPHGVPAVSLKKLDKAFGDVTAVANLDLDIPHGEFFSMLGPSGSGKTTVLRLIAGFETASSGQVFLEGTDVTGLAPFDRDVNTVFQDYALFPHMSIQLNVEYGLRARKIPKAERIRLASDAIESVKLSHLADRLPHQLSGGQRQRIALARALVLRPKVLLLDEPLGALDKQLRQEMQVELKRIQREAGITFIFVTHDQEEAMRMSDRIAVFNQGKIEQIGTPREVYENPSSAFVASFLGVSNLISGPSAKELLGSEQMVNVRPERIRLHKENAKVSAGDIGVKATITDVAYTGANTLYVLEAVDGLRLIATRLNEELPGQDIDLESGDRVLATFRKEHVAKIPIHQ
jgi:putative spermidine/putrescine transport system ATP-binding protein